VDSIDQLKPLQGRPARFNRLEVIDHRAAAEGAPRKIIVPVSDDFFDVTVSIQDDGRTLKIFLADTETPPSS